MSSQSRHTFKVLFFQLGNHGRVLLASARGVWEMDFIQQITNRFEYLQRRAQVRGGNEHIGTIAVLYKESRGQERLAHGGEVDHGL